MTLLNGLKGTNMYTFEDQSALSTREYLAFDLAMLSLYRLQSHFELDAIPRFFHF